MFLLILLLLWMVIDCMWFNIMLVKLEFLEFVCLGRENFRRGIIFFLMGKSKEYDFIILK